MNEFKLISHIKNDNGIWIEHSLSTHLKNVGKLSSEFSSKFGMAELSKIGGLFHDFGKAYLGWQEYIRDKSGYSGNSRIDIIPHAIHGAIYTYEKYGPVLGKILAYIIAGHHTGLYDWNSLFFEKFEKNNHLVKEIINENNISSDILNYELKNNNVFNKQQSISFLIRMMFSCLIDADRLDAELFFNQEKFNNRKGYISLNEMNNHFNNYMKRLQENSTNNLINEKRNQILNKCELLSKQNNNLFSLTVPTGGGKTLSSLKFALSNAITHNKDRIIYVIPYTSIIEQTASIFKQIFGKENVLEHHSNIEYNDNESNIRNGLSTENWDAPIIVTTNVQFFESLFSSRPNRCRKLHNIVNSIVILDEVQLLPSEFLYPILRSIDELSLYYNTNFVLSTATQPALLKRNGFDGLENVIEIIGTKEEVNDLYRSLNRINICLPENLNEKTSWAVIANELIQYEQVLCIVNTRKDARDLYKLLPSDTIHLSRFMCGQHILDKIIEIKGKLKNNEPVRVVSTQLVEAGVDFDFPIVYRAMIGLDSLAQAAGRCNREGKLESGTFKVFIPESEIPLSFKSAYSSCMSILEKTEDNNDLFSPKNFDNYFQNLFWKRGNDNLDKKGILKLLQDKKHKRINLNDYINDRDYIEDNEYLNFNFKTISDNFKLINDEDMISILVNYKNNIDITNIDKNFLRKVQRYMVNVYEKQFDKLKKTNSITEICENMFLLNDANYNDSIGVIYE